MKSGQLNTRPIEVLATRFRIASDGRFVNVAEVVRHEHRNFLPNHLLNGVSKYLLSCMIHEENFASNIDCSDAVRGRFRQSAETGLAREEYLFSRPVVLRLG